MEQLEYNLLFRWFVGLNMDEAVWVPTVFTKNRDRLWEGDIAEKFFQAVLTQARVVNLLSDEHFSVDGTLIEAWASQKSLQRKDRPAPPRDDPGNPTVDFHGETRSNDTHESTTDPDARLARKSGGHESKLAYCGNVMIENRNGLVVDTELDWDEVFENGVSCEDDVGEQVDDDPVWGNGVDHALPAIRLPEQVLWSVGGNRSVEHHDDEQYSVN